MSDPQQPQKLSWEQEALNLVWQQRAPTSWRLFQGTRTPESAPWLAGFVAVLVLVVGFGIAGLASLWLIYPFWVNGNGSHYKHAALLSNVSPSSYWLVVAAIVVGLALLIAISIGIDTVRTNRKERQDPQPLLIVLPEGWVQYIKQGEPAQAVAFAELKHLREGVNPSEEITTLADLQKGKGRPHKSTTQSKDSKRSDGAWLDIAWREGDDREDWEPDKCFDAPEAICQAILAAYENYTAQSKGSADDEIHAEG